MAMVIFPADWIRRRCGEEAWTNSLACLTTRQCWTYRMAGRKLDSLE